MLNATIESAEWSAATAPSPHSEDNTSEEHLTALYQRYAPLVKARATRMFGTDAEDLVHEVFVRMLSGPPVPEAIAAQWIYRTSTNLMIDRLRHGHRRDASWRSMMRCALEPEPTCPVDVDVMHRELCARVLSRLDRKTQSVVILVLFDEMPHTEVAKVLGISRRTVAARFAAFQDSAKKMVQRWTS